MNRSLLALSIALVRNKALRYIPLTLLLVLVIFLATSVSFIASGIKKIQAQQIGNLPSITLQRVVGGRIESVSEERIDEILTIAGVEWALGRVWGYYFFPHVALQNGGANFTILGIDPFEPHFLEDDSSINLEESGIMHVGTGVYDAMQKSFNRDSLTLISPTSKPHTLRLGELLEGAWSYDFIVLHKDEAREILGVREGEVTDIVVQVTHEAEIPTIASKLIELYPDSRVLSKEQILLAYESVIDYKSGLFLVLFITVLLALSIALYNQASILSSDERREIALLRALGFSVGEVMWLKALEHLYLIATALFVGILGAYLFVYIAKAPLLWHIFISSSDLTPPFSPQIGAEFFELISYALLGAFLYFAVVLIPIWRACASEMGEWLR